MAIRLADGTLILHVPKTGGRFVEFALQWLGVPHEQAEAIGGQCPRHGTKDNYGPASRIVATVRHPCRWIESWWRYQVGGLPDLSRFTFTMPYGEELFPIHRRCGDDFAALVTEILREAPGLVTRLFRLYTDGATDVMRLETIEADLAALLGIERQKLQAIALQNVSRPDRIPVWAAGAEAAWMKAESEVLEKWYAS